MSVVHVLASDGAYEQATLCGHDMHDGDTACKPKWWGTLATCGSCITRMIDKKKAEL